MCAVLTCRWSTGGAIYMENLGIVHILCSEYEAAANETLTMCVQPQLS